MTARSPGCGLKLLIFEAIPPAIPPFCPILLCTRPTTTSRFRWSNNTVQHRIVNPRQYRRQRHQIWREGRSPSCTMAVFAMGWQKPDNVAGSSAPAIMVGLFVATGGLLFGYDTG